jgi:hypothetical protein
MKKALFIILGLFLTGGVYAQKSVIFKSDYLPEHTYKTTGNTVLKMNMHMTNDSTHLTDPKAKRDAMDMEMRMGWNADLKTLAASGSKPLAINITGNGFSAKAITGGSEGALPMNDALSGQTIVGFVNDQGRIIADSTSTDYLAKSLIVKATMGFMLGAMPSPIKFPASALKIGDTFTQDIPSTTLNFANIGFNEDIVVKCTYKLTALKDNLAYFDTVSEFTKDFTRQDKGRTLTGKTTGTGAGKIIFNIAKNFAESFIDNEKVSFYVETGLKKMNIQVNHNTDAKYVIAAN